MSEQAGQDLPQDLLTVTEVIAILRVSRSTFDRWRRLGNGPATVALPGGGVRIRREALQLWLRARETATTSTRQEGQEGS